MNSKKTRLTVAHNGDAALVPQLATFESIESVYGKMPTDLVGGGRVSSLLKDINSTDLKKLIDQAHDHGLQYVYLLNAPCLSNLETTRNFNDKLFAFIGTLVDMGVDRFVIAMPYLLDLVKRHFPSMRVSVSTFATIDSARKAKLWEERGADRLILRQDIYRDFALLEKIRKTVSCELELFANNLCIDQCPYSQFHATFLAHSSNSIDAMNGFSLDYYAYRCILRRLENPVEFIQGRFIRPEDIHLYEDIGIDVFKIADRIKPTHWLVNVASAYNDRRFDGNLAHLIGYPYIRGDNDHGLTNPAKWLLRPDFVHLDVLKEIAHLAESRTLVYIDNRKLDGFCEHFKTHDCRTVLCGEECTYCYRYAEAAVTLDTEGVADRLKHCRRLLEMMFDRSAFLQEPFFKRVFIKSMKTGTSAFEYLKKAHKKIIFAH